MAQLTWQNIQTDFTGGGSQRSSGFSGGGFDMVNEALKEIETKQKGEVAAREVQKGMSISDPALFQEAMRRGVFKVTPENYEFFKGRVGELLGEQKTRQDMSLAASQEERAKELQAGQEGTRKLTNEGLVLSNEKSLLDLNKGKEDLALAHKRLELSPAAQQQAAAMTQMAINGDLAGAQKLWADPKTQKLFVDAGWTPDVIANYGSSLNTVATEARKQETQAADKAQELKLRERGQGIAETKQIAEQQAATAQVEKGTADAADWQRDREITEQARIAYQKLESGPFGGSLKSLYEGAGKMDLPPEVRVKLMKTIEAAAGAFSDKTPQEILDTVRSENPNEPSGPRRVGEGYTPAAGSIVDLLGQTEGDNDYRTLFGHSEKKGGPFAGVDVTKMTIGQLDQFAKGGPTGSAGYGDWVKSQNNGVWASPMGRYQIVNDTLQSVANTLGMSPDTVFDKDTQDKIFTFLVNQRLGNRGSMESKLEGMRQEWAGLRKVDDATLTKAIQDFQNGHLTGLTGAIEGTPEQQGNLGPGAVIPYDETRGKAASEALDRMIKKPEPLNPQDLSILADQAKVYGQLADIEADRGKAADVFEGQDKGLLEAMQDPTVNKKSLLEVTNEIKKDFPEEKHATLISEVKWAVENLGVAPGVAKAFVENAPVQKYWFNPFRSDAYIDHDKMVELFSRFYRPDIKDPVERTRGALEFMQSERARSLGVENLKTYQADLANATTEAANVAYRKRANPKIDDKIALRKVKIAQERLDAELERLDAFNTARMTDQTKQ